MQKVITFKEQKNLTHTVTHTGEKMQRTGKEIRLPNRCAVLFR